jgi:hypothetical protein
MEGITSGDIGTFLREKVNLTADVTKKYREQVAFLRTKLENHVAQHPDFALVKLLHFGSLAKGTAVSTLREMDLAAYLKADGAKERALQDVLEELHTLLVNAYPQMDASQFEVDPPAVTITYRGSALKVDVVPVIPNGKANDRGLLALRGPSGKRVETSIPLHLEFIRKRKEKYPLFVELVRLTKWWRNEKELPISSFELELLWCHLFGTTTVPADYQEAMLAFFAYLERTKLAQRIVFTDNYKASDVLPCTDIVQIYDPVTPSNNVSAGMTVADREIILRAAEGALDSVAAGSTAYSKGRGVSAYQQVFGSSFSA